MDPAEDAPGEDAPAEDDTAENARARRESNGSAATSSAATRLSTATVMFTIEDSDEDDEGNDTKDAQEAPMAGAASESSSSAQCNSNHRLSFMFEHNNLISPQLRIEALANDLRTGKLLYEDPEEPGKKAEGSRRSSNVRSRNPKIRLLVPPEDAEGTPSGRGDLAGSASCGMASFRLQRPGKGRKALVPDESGTRSRALSCAEGDSSPSRSPRSPRSATAFADESAELQKEIRELRKKLKDYKIGAGADADSHIQEMATLRASLRESHSQQDELLLENGELRKDLRKCQVVIERLAKELENVTRQLSLQAVPKDTGKEGEATSEATKEADVGFMEDLSSAIGSFFGGLGTSKPREQPPSRPSSDTSSSSSEEDVIRWAEVHGKNVELVGSDGQIAAFVGGEKNDLHAFVVTEESPMLEADQGYGFEITITKVRSGEKDGLSIGFTETPPEKLPKELPESADRIAKTFLVGFGGEVYDGCDMDNEWQDGPWNPANLQSGDRVGIQVSLQGDMFVLVNGVLVHECSWKWYDSKKCGPLYGIVDLLGNTDAVQLMDVDD